jgi:glycyl-tRNA synthetase
VTLGKKYARADEIGIPFAITVDRDTVLDRSVTLREVETTK